LRQWWYNVAADSPECVEMPYCPKCRDEFQDWVKTCPDCRVALVAELPPVSAPASKRKPARTSPVADEALVLVAASPHRPVAEMWAGILEDKGIHSVMKTYPSVGISCEAVASPIQPAIVQFEIYVLPPDAEMARGILDGICDDSNGIS
jgi:hypothetical protein